MSDRRENHRIRTMKAIEGFFTVKRPTKQRSSSSDRQAQRDDRPDGRLDQQGEARP